LLYWASSELRRCRYAKKRNCGADNLSKASWSWGCVSAIDSRGERCGLQTRIAATKTPSLPTAKSDQRLANYDEQRWLARFKVLERN
jgi:hypothetical protein